MARRFLIVLLCLAVASFGVSGMHVHLADHDLVPHADPAAHLTSVIDDDHFVEHGKSGTHHVEVELTTKAFGKLSILQVFVASILIYLAIGLLSRGAGTLQLRPFWTGPPRPKPRIFGILPPSHAPPATATAR